MVLPRASDPKNVDDENKYLINRVRRGSQGKFTTQRRISSLSQGRQILEDQELHLYPKTRKLRACD